MAEEIDDWDEYLENLYKTYYENILDQMLKQGFSKVNIAVQRVMYEKREDLFEEFCERYDLEPEDIEDE